MPDTLTRPPDLRTAEGRAWKAAQGVTEPTVTTSETPPAPVAPLPPAAPVSTPARAKIVPPDEFLYDLFTRDPQSVLHFQGQPNPQAALASAGISAYTGYLLILSPRFRKWYVAQNPDIRHIPDANAVWTLYDAAVAS